MLGVLGGGQLGAMFAAAARRLGYRVAVWDPDNEAPALRLADLEIGAPFTSDNALAHFCQDIAAATYEWENVPTSLAEAVQARVPLRPSARVLGIVQNRLSQKSFLAEHHIPVSPFHPLGSAADLAVPDRLGFPCLCKTATAGYDGKGQWRLMRSRDVEALKDELTKLPPSAGPWILEQFIDFEKELSVLVVRSESGERRSYLPSENLHEEGILRWTRAPADLDPRVARRAVEVAEAVVEALEGVGVFCVELFLQRGGRLLVNEVAPRPHNSGHYTLDACTVSQFEQQVRVLCGLPLGETRQHRAAVMVNLIGEDLQAVAGGEGLVALMQRPNAKLHVYGKRVVRARRKMGHVTFLADKPEEAWEQAADVLRLLRQARNQSGCGNRGSV